MTVRGDLKYTELSKCQADLPFERSGWNILLRHGHRPVILKTGFCLQHGDAHQNYDCSLQHSKVACIASTHTPLKAECSWTHRDVKTKVSGSAISLVRPSHLRDRLPNNTRANCQLPAHLHVDSHLPLRTYVLLFLSPNIYGSEKNWSFFRIT